jgi:hypothetical protein
MDNALKNEVENWIADDPDPVTASAVMRHRFGFISTDSYSLVPRVFVALMGRGHHV